MSREMPRLATWILETFAGGTNHETVAGDIAERYTAGRSHLWYWRQVLVAIAISLTREVRTNTSGVVRALIIGWGLVLISIPVQHSMLSFVFNPRVSFSAWTTPVRQPDLLPLTGWSALFSESWTTVRWDYKQGWIAPWGNSGRLAPWGGNGWVTDGMGYVFALLTCMLAFGIGWLLGRLHRPYQAKIVLIFVVSWFIFLVP
jgi:hypothetical protein